MPDMIGQVTHIIYDNVIHQMPSNKCLCSSRGIKLYAEGDNLTAISKKGVMWKDEGEVRVAVACEEGIILQYVDGTVCFLTEKFQDNVMNVVYDIQISLTGVSYNGHKIHKIKMAPDGMANITLLSGKTYPVETRLTDAGEFPEDFKEEVVIKAIPTVEEPVRTDKVTKSLNRMLKKPGLLTFLTFVVILGSGAALIGHSMMSPNRVKKEKIETADELLERLESDWKFPEQVATPGGSSDLYFGAAPDKYGYSTKQDAPRPKSLGEARLLNSDAVGWIRVPGCSISDPLFSYKEVCGIHGVPDNCFYLCRNIEKARVFSGNPSAVTFVDFRNDLSNHESLSPITVIYGHNWTNTERGTELRVNNIEDKQFAQLPSFADKKFAEDRRSFELTLADNTVERVAIFAAFYTEVNTTGSFYYANTDADGDQLLSIVERAKKKSEFVYPVGVNKGDKLVVLSTCTMKDAACGQNERFVVMGKVVQENTTIPQTHLKINESKEGPTAKATGFGTGYGDTQIVALDVEEIQDRLKDKTESKDTSKDTSKEKEKSSSRIDWKNSDGYLETDLDDLEDLQDLDDLDDSRDEKVVYTLDRPPLSQIQPESNKQTGYQENQGNQESSSEEVKVKNEVPGISVEVSSTAESDSKVRIDSEVRKSIRFAPPDDLDSSSSENSSRNTTSKVVKYSDTYNSSKESKED